MIQQPLRLLIEIIKTSEGTLPQKIRAMTELYFSRQLVTGDIHILMLEMEMMATKELVDNLGIQEGVTRLESR